MRISPRWGLLLVPVILALAAEAGIAALGDIEFERGGEAASAGVRPAVFPHWVHRIRFRCYVCHPRLFEMQQGANEITMEKMKQGQYCGACHNGTTAFSVEFQNCTRCHRELAE